MTKLQIRSLIYQLLCFGILFIGLQFLIKKYTDLSGLWIMGTAFVSATLLSPQFQAVKTKDGEKLFMKWMFMRGVRQIK